MNKVHCRLTAVVPNIFLACFAAIGYHGSNPGMLVSRPLTIFDKALEVPCKHAGKDHHKIAVVRADEFSKTMSSEQPINHSRIKRALADRISINCQKLGKIMKTVEFCGRQNIALHGHQDNAANTERDFSGSENHGNLPALLKFRVEANDTVLGEHLSIAAWNTTYTSNTVQNQIINVLVTK